MMPACAAAMAPPPPSMGWAGEELGAAALELLFSAGGGEAEGHAVTESLEKLGVALLGRAVIPGAGAVGVPLGHAPGDGRILEMGGEGVKEIDTAEAMEV